jgi:hypothetical protein
LNSFEEFTFMLDITPISSTLGSFCIDKNI